jgi:hypothetical protein
MDGIDPGRERVQAFRRRAGTPNRIVLTKLPAASANPPDTRNFQIRDSLVYGMTMSDCMVVVIVSLEKLSRL